jgi:hypothetical protein
MKKEKRKENMIGKKRWVNFAFLPYSDLHKPIDTQQFPLGISHKPPFQTLVDHPLSFSSNINNLDFNTNDSWLAITFLFQLPYTRSQHFTSTSLSKIEHMLIIFINCPSTWLLGAIYRSIFQSFHTMIPTVSSCLFSCHILSLMLMDLSCCLFSLSVNFLGSSLDDS